MSKIIKPVVVVMIAMLLFSCTKEEGEGGSASIIGKVFVKNYKAPPCPCKLIEEYYAQGENVYIIYGNQKGVGDMNKTAYDGTYEFQYLRPGNYKVYSLSKDTLSLANSKTIEKMLEVNIPKGKDLVILSDIVIVK